MNKFIATETPEIIVDTVFIDTHQNLIGFKDGMQQVACAGCTDFSVDHLQFKNDKGEIVPHTKIDKYNIQGMTYQGIIGLEEIVPRNIEALETRLCEMEKHTAELEKEIEKLKRGV